MKPNYENGSSCNGHILPASLRSGGSMYDEEFGVREFEHFVNECRLCGTVGGTVHPCKCHLGVRGVDCREPSSGQWGKENEGGTGGR